MDVLCSVCRDTIRRLVMIEQHKPVGPMGAKVTQIDSVSAPALAVAKEGKRKRKARRFQAFALYENGENIFWG
jgi:hypothetical protein